MDTTQTIISFCTGYGGLELGLEAAGLPIKPVAYVERDAYAAANLVAKIEENRMVAAPIWSDVATFPSEQFRGKIHGIVAGYPCQPFSLAGKRRGGADERWLWDDIASHIQAIKPLWCFFENVAGHLSLGFEEVLKELFGLGYKVEAGLFTAAEVGLPQLRARLFVLAYANGYRGYARLTERERDYTHNIVAPSLLGEPQKEFEAERAVKPRLGRAAYGHSTRVDRLRLCGNGVVPATAAKAFIELNNRCFKETEI